MPDHGDGQVTEALSLRRVGGPQHEMFHRVEHCRFYLPLFELAFGAMGTWGDKDALVAFAGRGREAEFLTPYCKTIRLTDNYPECCQHLRRRYATEDRPYIEVIDGNGVDFRAVPDQSIDILTALVALMHIRPLGIRESYACEIARVLKPGGRCLIQVAQTRLPSMDWATTTDGAAYIVDGGGLNVGFTTEADVIAWWTRYLDIIYVLRTPTYPEDATMENWWWIIGTRRRYGG